MTEVWAVLGVAALFVLFVLAQKNRGCPGADDCDGGGTERCVGCPYPSRVSRPGSRDPAGS